MNIDWSKAPEGATHAGSFKGKFSCWYKLGSGWAWEYMSGLSFSWEKVSGNLPASDLIERPKKQDAWDGEGLPPVGTVCNRINGSTSKKVEIIAHFDGTADRVAAYIPIEGRILVDQAIASCFKPIKTKEEIEKEKYLSEILVISNIISMATGFAGPTVNNISRSIYGAGYRKQ